MAGEFISASDDRLAWSPNNSVGAGNASLPMCSSSPSSSSSSSGYDTDGSTNGVVKSEKKILTEKRSIANTSLHICTNINSNNNNNNNNNNSYVSSDDHIDGPENDDRYHDLDNQCSRCEMRDDLEVSQSLPKLGRKQPINVVTIFAKGDDKRHLLECPDLITIHDLNPREDLIEQWSQLSLPPQGPDLILTKLHKALGSRDLKPSAAALMTNYESLRRHHWSVFQRLELVPLETEIILTNRFTMQDLIDKVCNAVNLTLGSSASPKVKFPPRAPSCSGDKATPRQRPKEAKVQLSEIFFASRSIRATAGADVVNDPLGTVEEEGTAKEEEGTAKEEQGGVAVGGSVLKDIPRHHRSMCSKPKSVRMHFSTTTTLTTTTTKPSASQIEGLKEEPPTSEEEEEAASASVSASTSSVLSLSSSSVTFSSSMSLSPIGEATSLPPFPLVVKSSSTSTKGMAMVLDEAALRHFASAVVGGGVVIEQFVQHDNAILKMYVIGREIFVVRRRSLPNVLSFTEAAVKQFAADVGGQFVPLDESPYGGYVVYQSDKMPKTNHGVTLLEECDDLDGAVLRLLTQALARELRVDLFGFDVLIESKTKNIFVVDVNVLPGFKGVPSCQRRLGAWLSFLATRRAFKEDCLSLLPQDLLRLSLSRNDEETRVNLETLQVRQITQNRIFEVMFKERLDSPGARARHTLVKFRPVQTPRRFVEDKDHFVSNLARVLASKGLGPSFIKDVSAVYFDRRRHLGMVRDWIEGTPLHAVLTRLEGVASAGVPSRRLDAIFRGVGAALAQFHLLGDDEEFRRGVIDRHFPGVLSTPVVFRLLEQWRRDAVLSLLCSRPALENHEVWGSLFAGVIEASRDIDGVIGVILERILTPEAAKSVFGHFDANTNNIIVCNADVDKMGQKRTEEVKDEMRASGGGESDDVAEIFLIDEEWAAPNVAIYDFAKFVTSASVLMARKLTKMTEAELRRGVSLMAEKYLKTMATSERRKSREKRGEKTNSEEEEVSVSAEKVEDFVDDVWTFVPLAALTNCFSNLVHASKEGQMSAAEIPSSGELFQKLSGAFNWLRHAQDHLSVFQKHFQRTLDL